jgi:hypothetical protein
MSSTTPITTPAQSPCKAAVATPARVTDPPCIDAATPTAAATKSEPRAPTTPVVRAATDDEPQQQPLPPCAGSVATDEPHGEDSPAPALKKLRTEATLHEAVSQPTPLTAVPAPAAEVASTTDEPTATATAMTQRLTAHPPPPTTLLPRRAARRHLARPRPSLLAARRLPCCWAPQPAARPCPSP